MSQFNTKIINAKKQQQRFILKVAFVFFFLVALFNIIYFLVFAKKVIVEPKVKDYQIEFISGKGLHFLNKILFFSKSINIKVDSAGYETYQNIFTKKDLNEIYIKLTKKDTNLTFKTNAEVGENNWFLDDELISNEQVLSLKIKPGIYSLRIENNFYKTKLVDLNITNDLLNHVYDLKLERTPVSINISTEPSNAILFIGKSKIGSSPLSYDLTTGKYEFRLEKEGYQSILEKIELNNFSTNFNKNYVLMPNKVYVNFKLEPKKGNLFINNTLYSEPTKLSLYTNKKYKFIYKKNGYITKKNEYFFFENKKNLVSFSLEKEYGEIDIVSHPIGKIVINDKDYGTSPKKIKLQTIPSTLKISKEGYNTFTTSFTTKPNELSKIDIKLEKKMDSINRKSKNNYTNSIGINFKLFSPDRFTMGAPRHEKGQRANEFLKDVILRKKFYAALTEVTIEQFMLFKGKSYDDKNKNLPISNISWLEAIMFCNWLSKKEGLDKVYLFKNKVYEGANLQSNGYRLPTEAEWEWLARKSGRNSATKFSWGKNLPIPKMAGNLADESVIGYQELYIPNYKDNYKLLAPVGSFKKDISGLYDLTGNVKEWVHDYYLVSVPKSNMIYYDPAGPKKGVGHIIKGSSFLSASLHEVRASYRESEVYKKEDIGFRIVRYLFGKEFKNDKN